MKKLDKQFFQSILIVIVSIIIFFLVIAFFVKLDEYKKLNYKVDAVFDGTDIVVLSNELPLSDEMGKSYKGTGMKKGIAEYKEFTVYNRNEAKVKYEIYLTKLDTDVKNISSNYIKLYLTDDKNIPLEGFEKKYIKNFYELDGVSNRPGSRLLYTGTLTSGSSKKFILRSWVADTYIVSSDKEGFSFDIDVRIK